MTTPVVVRYADRSGLWLRYGRSATARYPGDLGPGLVRLGANNGTAGNGGEPIATFDTNHLTAVGSFPAVGGAHKHSTVRSYNNKAGGGGGQLALQANDITALTTWIDTEGRMPVWSCKYPGGPITDITSGKTDTIWDQTFAFFDARSGPCYACLWHEPEDDFPAGGSYDPTGAKTYGSADQYRAAYQYVIARYRSGGHRNIIWCSPFFMSYTFSTAGMAARDFRKWHPNWTGSAWLTGSARYVDADGLDLYNPNVSPAAGDVNSDWATSYGRFTGALDSSGADRLPVVIAELGIPSDSIATSLTSGGVHVADFLHDLIAVGAVDPRPVVAACLWNNNSFVVEPVQTNNTNPADADGSKAAAWRAAARQAGAVIL